jgi:hypothetical protein
VADGVAPPPSRYPHISDGELVPPSGLAFPAIPGVDKPRVVHVAYHADYGPRFSSQGIVDIQPPELGAPFPSLVPQVDGLGNEETGVREIEVRVPLATYAPWNLRTGAPGGQDELTDFLGTFIPLPVDDAARAASGDPRPSIEALYPRGRVEYLDRVRQAAKGLVDEGFMLPEDLSDALDRAQALWSWVHAPPEGGSGAGAVH